ncbi:hypothetical protein HDK64DRAFT_111465 [Phyllosticta capitalensis]
MGWVGLGTFCWGSSSQPGRNRPRQGKVARRSRMMVGVGIGLFFFVVQLSVSFCLVLFLVVFVLLAHHDGVFPSFFSLWRQRPAACITRPDRWIRWDTHTHTHTHIQTDTPTQTQILTTFIYITCGDGASLALSHITSRFLLVNLVRASVSFDTPAVARFSSSRLFPICFDATLTSMF